MTALRRVLHAKIHHARVTQADLRYEGSVTIPPELLEKIGLFEFEAVHIWDVTNGSRLETYAICGKPGSHDICINGAAAHLIHPGDTVIIAAFGWYSEDEAKKVRPRVIFLDESNHVKEIRPEIPGPGKCS